MQRYVQIAFNSRGLDPDFDPAPICERCEARRSDDVHHLEGRNGKLLNDPKNLMFLCRDCHTNVGNREWRERAKSVVEAKIKNHKKDLHLN